MPDPTSESAVLLSKPVDPAVKKLRLTMLIAVLALFFIAVPGLNLAGVVPDHRVQMLGKYLCFAIVALGVDLVWGYTGLLTLCQALFFCIGGYCMAMFLSLPEGGGDVRPEYNNIPQFMYFNNLRELPIFWRPFSSIIFAVVGGVGLAMFAAAAFGFVILRNRVRGVYFSIITQAVAWGAWLTISRNEMLLGGTNGLTNFNKAHTTTQSWILSLYLLTAAAVVIAYLVCRWIIRSRLGRVLVAVRDKESRLYFAGYKPHAFKVFAFAMGAGLAALGGMLYSPQVGIITPQDMHVEASIFMVILVAVGGRGSLWGAILGALLVTYARSSLTTEMAEDWLLVYGLIFVSVVLFFPDGFAGLWKRVEQRIEQRQSASAIAVAAVPVLATCLFVTLEALGMFPDFLTQSRLFGLQWHYLLLISLIVAGVVLDRYVVERSRPTEGFPVIAAKA
jgi:urea transport system permease protein